MYGEFWIYNVFSCLNERNIFYKHSISIKQLRLEVMEETGCSKSVSADYCYKEWSKKERQAPKRADVWPIENVWTLIKAEVNAMDPQTKEELRIFIKKSWARMVKNDKLCKKLIGSIPVRLQAVIKKEGRQVDKADYQ